MNISVPSIRTTGVAHAALTLLGRGRVLWELKSAKGCFSDFNGGPASRWLSVDASAIGGAGEGERELD